jgi:hypothetical protein
MENKDIEAMMGLKSGDAQEFLKLNEVGFSGDTGKFRFVELLAGKGEDGKYPVQELGDTIKGVIIKMKWRLFKYEEDAQGKGVVTSSTEYDNKNTDEVFVFNANEKGIAVEMKEKFALKTQRVIYLYLPDRKETVRLIVKASALTGDKNPNDEKGLFEYQNELEEVLELPIDYVTEMGGCYREDTNNPRKSYYAMHFKTDRKLESTEREKMVTLLVDIDGKTKVRDVEVHTPEVKVESPFEEDEDDSEIPF